MSAENLHLSQPLGRDSAKRIRHAISTGLSFIETSVRNLSGKRPNAQQALKLYSVGSDKLQSALSLLDSCAEAPEASDPTGSYGIKEAVFTAEHPEVLQWTEYFNKCTADAEIFQKMEREHSAPSRERAVVIGALWNRFSAFMPWFLCQSAASVSTNEKRHYVIQTAFEELGMRNVGDIHPDMFWDAAKSAGINEDERKEVLGRAQPRIVLDSLRKTLLGYSSDEEVLGILLGLEIPARENIEAVFSGLAHSDDIQCKLNEDRFFRLHRQIEIEHVRLTVSNFLRFCKDEAQKERFVRGFNEGLRFWKQFWDSAADEISVLKGAGSNV